MLGSEVGIKNEEEFKEHVLNEFPKEACGLVVASKIEQGFVFVPCENIAEKPEQDFKIKRDLFLKYKAKGVLHSHIKVGHQFDLRTPSMADMRAQKSTAVPWGIVGCDGENVSDILWFGVDKPPPIVGRVYVPNVYDCLTIVCDHLKLEYGIKVPTFPRPTEWYNYNKNFITDGLDEAGFDVLPKDTHWSDLRVSDAILFKIQGNYVNHCGLHIGEGKFVHHLMNRLSQEDYLGRWEKQIYRFVRHRDVENHLSTR